MNKLVAMFAGQGSQKQGMGAELFVKYPEIIAEANNILGYSIEDLCLDSDSKRLDQTQFTQPALYVLGSLLWLESIKLARPLPDVMIGHSLGEYIALYAAGMYSFADGLRIVKKRAELMAACQGGGMLAVVDLSASELSDLLSTSGIEQIFIANYNSPRQTIVAGSLTDLESLQNLLRIHGKGRAFSLNVSGAFHSPWMQKAYIEFQIFLSSCKFAEPTIAVLSQNDLKPFTPETAPQQLAQQLIKPLRFQENIEFLLDQGYTTFEEFAARPALSKFVHEIRQSRPLLSSQLFFNLKDDNLLDLLKIKAQKERDTIALSFIIYEDGARRIRHLSFQELDSEAERVAAYLQHKGLQPGDRVLIFGTNAIDNIIAICGAVYAGAIFTLVPPPIDPAKQQFFRSVLDSTKARFILSSGFVIEKLDTKMTDGMLPRWLMRKLIKVLKKLELVAVDRIPERLPWRKPSLKADDLLYLQYSSGSTQAPKGVMISHRNFIANSLGLKQGNAPRLKDLAEFRSLIWAPIFHNTGLLGIFQFLFQPCQVYVMSPLAFIEKPLRWFETITEFQIHLINAPNSIYEICAALIKEQDLSSLDLCSLRVAGCGAEPVYAETLSKFAQKFGKVGFRSDTFTVGYGLAESTCIVTLSPPGSLSITVDSEMLRRNQLKETAPKSLEAKTLISVGEPVLGNSLVIVDPETLNPLKPGQIGEIWVSGPSLSQGYWLLPELSKLTFGHSLAGYPGTFLRTGDLGAIYAGRLFITGRQKELMIINGHNIFPGDVEQAVKSVLNHPAILRIAAGAIVREKSERIVVFIEVAKGVTLNFARLSEQLSAKLLQEFGFTPYDTVFVNDMALPRTNTGKVQTLKSKELYEQGQITALYQSRTTQSQEAVPSSAKPSQQNQASEYSALYQELLQFFISEMSKINAGIKIEASTSVNELGLDSLTLNYLSSEIASRYRIDLDPTLFFASKTVGDILTQVLSHLPEQLSQTVEQPAPSRSSSGNTNQNAIAIIGVSAQLPQASELEEFWPHLREARDLIREIPAQRWDWQAAAQKYPAHANRLKWGGFLEGVDEFDHQFFGISPKEAALMDPQQRLLLQTAWRTIETAGYRASDLKGRSVGVFIGASTHDYASLLQQTSDREHPFAVTGNAKTMLSNRLSHYFDFTGPSELIDTACSSSLVAIHRAIRAIRSGECEMALAGGVNLMLIPEIHNALSQAGMLSPNGRCQTFDAQAQGYVRSEGVGLLLLKPLEKAEQSLDFIHGVLLGSAVNHGGKSASLTAPDRNAQTRLLLDAWRDAGISAKDLSYIETHGTGTSLGDPIELGAIKAAFAQESNSSFPSICHLGAVKTVCGHLESAAGMAGVAKVLLAFEHQEIPRNLHFQTVNPLLKLDNSPLRLVNSNIAWPASSSSNHRARIAGISSFGFGGSNAHIVLSDYQARLTQAFPEISVENVLIVLSAKSKSALMARVESLLKYLDQDTSLALPLLAQNLYYGRETFPHRLALLVQDYADLISQLKQLKSSELSAASLVGKNKLKSDSLAHKALLRWLAGETSDLGPYIGSSLYRKHRLPAYVFDKNKHWFREASNKSFETQNVSTEQAEDTSLLQNYLARESSLPRALCAMIIDQASRCLDLSSESLTATSDLRLLGLDSIGAMQLLSDISRLIDIKLSPSAFQGMETPEALAQAIYQQHNAEIHNKMQQQPRKPEHSELAPGVELIAIELWSEAAHEAKTKDLTAHYQVTDLKSLDAILKTDHQLQARLRVTLENQRRIELCMGGSGSTLAFLPAFGMNHTQWHPQFEYFTRRHRVVAITLPGFGRSDSPVQIEYAAIVEMIAEALDSIGASQALNLVGSSFGGLIARKFAHYYPERLASLTMVNSPLSHEQMPSLDSFRSGLEEELLQVFDNQQRAVYKHAVDLIDIDFYRNLFQQKGSLDLGSLTLPVPTLIVTGKKDGIISWEKSASFAQGQGHIQVRVFDSSGHFPNISHCEQFNQELKRFISRNS